MDTKKQPGIEFVSIILTNSQFYRSPQVPNDMDIEIDFDVKKNIDNEKTNASISMDFNVKGISKENEEYISLKANFLAFFKASDENTNMDLDEFVENNAPALMVPYIREFVSNITSRSGINPIMLPPINVAALLKRKEEEQK